MTSTSTPLVKVTVTKETFETNTGIKCQSDADKTIVISDISEGSIFRETTLDVGYELVSINGIRCKGLPPEACEQIIANVENDITIVAKDVTTATETKENADVPTAPCSSTEPSNIDRVASSDEETKPAASGGERKPQSKGDEMLNSKVNGRPNPMQKRSSDEDTSMKAAKMKAAPRHETSQVGAFSVAAGVSNAADAKLNARRSRGQYSKSSSEDDMKAQHRPSQNAETTKVGAFSVAAGMSDTVDAKINAKRSRAPPSRKASADNDMKAKSRGATGRQQSQNEETQVGAYSVAVGLSNAVDAKLNAKRSRAASRSLQSKDSGSEIVSSAMAGVPNDIGNAAAKVDSNFDEEEGMKIGGGGKQPLPTSEKDIENTTEVRPGAVNVGCSSYDLEDGFDELESGKPLSEEEVVRAETKEVPRDDVDLEISQQNMEAFGAETVVTAYAVEDTAEVQEAEVVDESKLQRHRPLMLAAIIIVLIIAVAIAVPVTLLTGNNDSSDDIELEFETIVEGLCAPRHLKVHNEKLYVPESGFGPIDEESALCVPSVLSYVPGNCLGNTGRVSMFGLDGSNQETLLSGLFSVRPIGGLRRQVYGAHAVEFDENGTMFTVIGLAHVNGTNLTIQDPELVFSSILKDDEPVATPWVSLYENNYADVAVVESNPFDMIMHNGIMYVVDPGADLLYAYFDVENAGTSAPDAVVVLPKIENIPAVTPNPRDGTCNDVPPPNGRHFCGQYQDEDGNWLYSAAPVPTVVRINPKEPNRIYVGYVVGSNWNKPVSGIFYMDLVDGVPQADTMKVIRGDFWAIIAFEFYEDGMIILETDPGGDVPFTGRLSKVTVNADGSVASMQVIEANIVEPVGLAIHDDILYLSNNTYSTDINTCNGNVARASLK